jgi:hypothetical protein
MMTRNEDDRWEEYREKPAAESCLAAGRGGVFCWNLSPRWRGEPLETRKLLVLHEPTEGAVAWMMPRLTGFTVRCGGDPSHPGEWSGALDHPSCGTVPLARDRDGGCAGKAAALGLEAAVGAAATSYLDPMYRLDACRRGRHRDALLISDDLAGSPLGDDYPELAVCEVCGRAVEWPNGKPTLVRREQE